MADKFLNVKRIRRVWFPENINGLYQLGKSEINDDVYALSDSIRRAEAAGAESQASPKRSPAKKLAQQHAREQEISQIKQRLYRMREHLNSQRATLQQVRAENKRHREGIGRTEYEIQSAEQEQKSLEENYQSLKEDYTQSIKSSKHNREGYEKSILEIRDQLQRETKLPADIFGSTSEVPRLKQEIATRNDRLSDLRTRLKNAQRQRNMMQEVLTKNSNATPGAQMAHQVVDYARSNAKQFSTFKLKLRDSIDEKKKAYQDLERRNREIESLTDEISKQANLNSALEAKDKELSQKAEHQKMVVQDLDNEVKTLQQEQEKREQEVQRLTDLHQTWDEILAATERRAETAEGVYTSTMTELRVYKLGKRTIDETVERLTKKRKVLTEENEQLRAQIRVHEERGDPEFKDKEKLDKLISQCRELYNRQQSLQKQVEQKEAEHRKSMDEISKLRMALDQAQDKLNEQQQEHLKQMSITADLVQGKQ
mmetsp:Transcript_2443/g.4745  ORF Transcript_2443/g.4745 Transcript_2443/m.4745 type:complete len:484 (+) Transcript_2443:29-1480(+)